MKMLKFAAAVIAVCVMVGSCISFADSSGSSGGGGSPAVQSRHQNGTYTVYPRPQLMREGQDIRAYLDKIVVRDGTFSLYFVSAPIGKNRDYPDFGNWAAYGFDGFIFDLDNPGRAPIQATKGDGEHVDGYNSTIWIFNNHSINRFRFEQRQRDSDAAPRILEEVVIGQPDTPYPGDPIQNGTYTFYPRPRFMRDGRDMDIYLDKVVVRGGYFNMYFVNVPEGASRDRPDFGNWAAYGFDGFIFDLDNPGRPPLQAAKGDGEYTDGNVSVIWSFENHNIRHFNFEQRQSDNHGVSARILEDIIIGQPD